MNLSPLLDIIWRFAASEMPAEKTTSRWFGCRFSERNERGLLLGAAQNQFVFRVVRLNALNNSSNMQKVTKI